MILDAAAAAVLAPLLAVQALGLRKRALKLPEADGARSGTLGSGPVLRLLIVGDSSAAGVGAETQDRALSGRLARALAPHHEVRWQLIAQTGASTRSTLDRIADQSLPQADIVLIILGVNDVTGGAPRHRWLRDHARLRATLRERTGARAIHVSQIPPLGAFPLLPDPLRWLLGRRALRFDTALRAALDTDRVCTHIPFPQDLQPTDMAEDGFHPGPAIYAAWAQEIARRILSDGPSR